MSILQKLLKTGLLLILMYVSLPAVAQKDKFYNYMSTDTSEEILKIQDFHIKQALLKIDQNQLAQAWGDFSYVL